MTLERFGDVTSASPRMHAVFARLREVVPLHTPVLLRGEWGSGRERLARALAEVSRPGRPGVVIDLATVPPGMLEGMLFGQDSVGFTGKPYTRRGACEEVEDGTLVFREIAACPWDLQPALLGLIERRWFRRIGSDERRPCEARLIFTTHTDLEALVANGALRPELYGALAGGCNAIDVPPLRARLEDLPQLLELEPPLLARLARLAWRGNFTRWQAFVQTLGASPEDAVAEAELLEAIEQAPEDLGLRQVYGDVLGARGEPLGELIHLQCRLAEGEDRKVRAAERRLATAHHGRWAAPVAALADSPATQSEVLFERGFVDGLRLEAEALRRLDGLVATAPLLRRLAVHGELGRECWISPALGQLRELHLTTRLGAPGLAGLAACPYLANLRALELGPELDEDDDDPELRRQGLAMLAASPVLAREVRLGLRAYRLTAEDVTALLGASARWTPHELELAEIALTPPVLDALLAAPRFAALGVLHVVGPLEPEARARLVAAGGPTIVVDVEPA